MNLREKTILADQVYPIVSLATTIDGKYIIAGSLIALNSGY